MGLQANFETLDETLAWKDDEMLECVSVVPEAPNTATFSFRAPSGAWFKYQPGQFLTLELPVPGETVWRTYTISSSPSRPLSISVTVKAQARQHRHPLDAGQPETGHVPQGLRPGRRVHPAETPERQVPVHLRRLRHHAQPVDDPVPVRPRPIAGRLFHQLRQAPSEIIARRQLEGMAARVPGIKLHFVVEEDDPYQVWTGYRGQLNQIMLGLIAGDYLEREVYCCGPEPFMQAVRDMLNGLGFDMENYNQESFGAPVETEADAPELDDVVPAETAAAEITFAASGVTATCTETDTVLAVAKASGLNIPSGCTFGICGTCKVKKTAGDVHMVHNGGISEEDVEAGYILACCSNPIGRVEVEI